jgi:cytochrome P450
MTAEPHPSAPPIVDVDPQAGTAAQLRDRYELLRAKCPVAHIDRHGGYVLVSGYPEVKQVTMARRDFSSADGVFIPPTGVPPVPALEFEGPEHRAWRKVFDELVSPRAVRRLEPVITEVVDTHIDAFIASGSVDLVPAYTHPVPGVVIGRLLGLNDQESLHSQQLADAFLAAIGTPEFEPAFGTFAEYVLGHLHDRRSTPRDDVLSQLATGSYQGMTIDDQVALQIFVSLLLGGHHSTASGLAGLLNHVLIDDEVRSRLLADPETVARAVEEGLRLTTPLQQFARTSVTDTTVGGYAVDKGCRLLLNYAAANRDPDEFADPHRFRLDRDRNRHLAFGGGAHICSGQHLARAELRIGVQRLLERIPDVALAGEVKHSGLVAAHMMTIHSLPVTFTPA